MEDSVKATALTVASECRSCSNHLLHVAVAVIDSVNFLRGMGFPLSLTCRLNLAMKDGDVANTAAAMGWQVLGVRFSDR